MKEAAEGVAVTYKYKKEIFMSIRSYSLFLCPYERDDLRNETS